MVVKAIELELVRRVNSRIFSTQLDVFWVQRSGGPQRDNDAQRRSPSTTDGRSLIRNPRPGFPEVIGQSWDMSNFG